MSKTFIHLESLIIYELVLINADKPIFDYNKAEKFVLKLP